MKREILCTKCAEDMEKLLGDGSQYPGEHVKYVAGTAKTNPDVPGGVSVCDSCMKSLPIGSKAVAVTIWADHSPNPYVPWEGDFLSFEGDT